MYIFYLLHQRNGFNHFWLLFKLLFVWEGLKEQPQKQITEEIPAQQKDAMQLSNVVLDTQHTNI